jgi:hypothetical protein
MKEDDGWAPCVSEWLVGIWKMKIVNLLDY